MIIKNILKLKKADGDIGIEIECEGDNLREVFNDVWNTEDDGSLRPHGGYPNKKAEFILKRPIPIKSVPYALENLHENLEGAKFKMSSRCSVHVHINVQSLEFSQLLAMMYAYYLLEDIFMEKCGEERKGNNFCLRIRDAEASLNYITELFKNGPDMLKKVVKDQNRYSALNFESISKYGSLEFRGMEGTMDSKRINYWCVAIYLLREYAIEAGSPIRVLEDVQNLGPIGFFDKVFKNEKINKYMYCEGIENKIRYAFSITIDLPFSYREVSEKVVSLPFKKGDIIPIENAREVLNSGGNVEKSGDKYLVTMDPLPKNTYVFKRPELTIKGI